ncbi:MAG: hypothetical protein AAFX87_24130 [Bacteroidota bacterium]
MAILFSTILFISSLLSFQDADLKASVSLMYRRSGETHKFFKSVSHGDTLSYFARNGNPYFRVYRINLTNASAIGREVFVESYLGDSLLQKTKPQNTRRTRGLEFVDSYVDETEDMVKVIIQYQPEEQSKAQTFHFFIKPG